MDARGKFGEHERSVRVGVVESKTKFRYLLVTNTNIQGKIFSKLSRHFVKQKAPSLKLALTRKQKQTNNSPVS